MAEKIRLDKFISSQRNDLSRKDVKELCRKGRVTVDEKVVKKSDFSVTEDSNVKVDGIKIIYRKYIYLMLNKPAGVVCSTHEGDSKTVLDLVPDEFKREGLFPAGRLDKYTEGFVLITDDGELAHKMLSPASHVDKTYLVRLENKWDVKYKQIMESGMTIDGGEKCLPAVFIPDEHDEFQCKVILHEGKFHQIKRMFTALGNKVSYLKRLSIGELELNSNLELGKCMEIMHKDVERLLVKNKF